MIVDIGAGCAQRKRSNQKPACKERRERHYVAGTNDDREIDRERERDKTEEEGENGLQGPSRTKQGRLKHSGMCIRPIVASGCHFACRGIPRQLLLGFHLAHAVSPAPSSYYSLEIVGAWRARLVSALIQYCGKPGTARALRVDLDASKRTCRVTTASQASCSSGLSPPQCRILPLASQVKPQLRLLSFFGETSWRQGEVSDKRRSDSKSKISCSPSTTRRTSSASLRPLCPRRPENDEKGRSNVHP